MADDDIPEKSVENAFSLINDHSRRLYKNKGMKMYMSEEVLAGFEEEIPGIREFAVWVADDEDPDYGYWKVEVPRNERPTD